MADANAGAAADEGKFEEARVAVRFFEQIGIGDADVFEAGVVVGGAFGIDQSVEFEAVDEAFAFARGHGLDFEVDEVDGDAAFFEEPFSGAGRLRVFGAEDLDGNHVTCDFGRVRWVGTTAAIEEII